MAIETQDLVTQLSRYIAAKNWVAQNKAKFSLIADFEKAFKASGEVELSDGSNTVRIQESSATVFDATRFKMNHPALAKKYLVTQVRRSVKIEK